MFENEEKEETFINMSNRNISLQLIRVVAMLMIALDHILSRLAFPMQAMIVQIANSGVFIFLLLSGFLYGSKEIQDWKCWLRKRICRICIPLWIFMIIDFVVEAILWNFFDIKYVFIYAFNLQGILGVNIGGTNLWFLTLIMFCYLLTPIFQWLKQQKYSKKFWFIVGISTMAVQVILAYGTDAGMIAGHTLSWCILAVGMYIIGYFAGDKLLFDGIDKIRIVFMTTSVVITSCVVLICKFKFDGYIIYDRIITYYGMIVIDLWICTVVYKLGTYIKSRVLNKCVTHLDMISYEFYIVHGLIIAAITAHVLIKYGSVLYVICTMMLSYLAAVILQELCIFIKYICEVVFKKKIE